MGSTVNNQNFSSLCAMPYGTLGDQKDNFILEFSKLSVIRKDGLKKSLQSQTNFSVT